MSTETKIIDYHLVQMRDKERGIYSFKVFDAKDVKEAKKIAKGMEPGTIINITVFYRTKD